MRDLKLFYDSGFDIEIDSTGIPTYVDTDAQTYDQRAAVACVITQGTIPTAETVGTDWSALQDSDTEDAVMTLYNSAKQMIDECVGSASSDITAQYLPLLTKDDDTGMITIKTVRGNAK